MFWWKPGILILDFVSLQCKIPTNINQNTVIILQQNHIYFSIIFANFYNFFFIYIYINNTKYNIYIYNNIKSGWAGPNHWAGLSPRPWWAEVGPKIYWADLGPKMHWADLGPKKALGRSRPKKKALGRSRPKKALGRYRPKKALGRSRPKKSLGRYRPKQKISSGPDPAQKTGLGQDPPGPATKRARGINFPPPLHAERYSFYMQRRK